MSKKYPFKLKKENNNNKPNKVYVCRHTIDINCPKEGCGVYNNSICEVDGKKCDCEVYVREKK